MAAGTERLYGTAELPAPAREIRCGPLSMLITSDMLRQIRWQGVELVRAISYPIRDRDWGTMPQRIVAESCDEAGVP